jgi:small conductance mechanosensitive channel
VAPFLRKARGMNLDLQSLSAQLYGLGIRVGSKLLGAFVLWIIGRWLIGIIKERLVKSLGHGKVDQTLITYIESATGVLLNIVLVMAILGVFGVETTTFAGLLAAAGVAIGMAWSGLLANFAAGAFLIVLKPFKKGDFIQVGAVIGTVHEVGLFVVTIDSPDNIRTYVGNNKVFGDTIQNFTTNPFRRVDRTAQLAHGADHRRAITLLKARVATVPNVMASPAPDVVILDFNLAGPVLAVRPYCHNQDYWQVYFDTNEAIRDELGKAGFPVPETHLLVETKAAVGA